MISYIQGTLVSKHPVTAVVETKMGIAFELGIPVSTFEALPDEGMSCLLYTHLHISQDDVRLFGFATKPEKELYQQLVRISGVGPKIALSILSTLSIQAFVKAIESEETALLRRVPGIGLKSAQRLVIELKGRVAHLLDELPSAGKSVDGMAALEVETALESLGFNLREIKRELSLLPSDARSMSSEQLIKEMIKRLYQKTK
ncbi:MAG TPA: Holliday junction branch migration protein RuvA [Candidatus Cloacimonadota bacterium]|nr:Holliday junction branch migration protein RuvA [Candidatus Cloacimonadota bacterium]HQH50137.1 Holliday junction branch migration protein RuvA [Candidatus Cloacimonadota bacterium]